MNKRTIDKAIDCIFEIIEDHQKVKALDDFKSRLKFDNDFFSFSSFLDANENRLIGFLDWFFYDLNKDFGNPDGEFFGLASYAIYDAATPYINGKPYNLKNKNEFKNYVYSVLNKLDSEKNA